MRTLAQILEPFASNTEFPTKKSEEYRYSSVITKLSELSIKENSGQKIDIPSVGDFTFYADNTVENTQTITLDKLSSHYTRHQNYFKNSLLSQDNKFSHIVCDKAEFSLDFIASENSALTHKVYLDVPAEHDVKINVNLYTQNNSLAMPLIFVNAKANANVEIIYTVDQNHNKGIIAPLFEIIANDHSNVSLQSFTQGIDTHRLTFIGFCDGIESHIDLRTGFNLSKKETCDLFVRIYHEAKDSTSNQMIKSVVDNSSQMNFNGLIYANGKAQNIYAYQMLKGMILNDDAEINARPQLDIEYFELACSHGVSIGGFDPEELFYLKSRGIKENDAYALLLLGFFSEPFVDTKYEEFWIDRIKYHLS